MVRLYVGALTLALAACGGGQSSSSSSSSAGQSNSGDEFELNDSDTAGQARGEHPSEIEPSATHAAMRLFVVNRDTNEAIRGIVIKMTAPDGTAFYTGETDGHGYAEVLVPIGQRYQMEYLSLGRRNTTANVDVPNERNQNIRLTMRYRLLQRTRPTLDLPEPSEPREEGFVLEDLRFDTGSAHIQEDSLSRLDRVVEYLQHRPHARIRIAGHTDNVGPPAQNQRLSEQRAQAVREYLVSEGIDGDRVEAVGYGDQEPVASNDTEEGRAQNRRIEAVEL